MILAVDIGNTKTKIALFENNSISKTWILEPENFLKKIKKILETISEKPQILLSSVGKLDVEALNWLKENTQINIISHQSCFPFQNKYTTPTTLGIDRMVLAAGAVIKYPNQNRLIIDAGTCITYDFVDSNNNYFGGAISPGINLRYKSLNDYTAKLPLLALHAPKDLIGNSTPESIHSGVINGITAEIDGIIEMYQSRFQHLTIILTGGDTVFLAERLKNTIFAQPNFLLESLNSIHQYIIENDKKHLSRP